MIPLSRRQLKAADRAAGLELVLPWPRGLPEPRLDLDEERDGTPAEWDAARRIVGIPREGARDGMLVRDVRAAVLRRPSNMLDRPDEVAPHLCVEIVTPRWFGATNRPAPAIAWWGGVRTRTATPESATQAEPPPSETAMLDYHTTPWPDLCRAWRARRGLSQATQAAVTRVPPATWKQWEQAARAPSPEGAWRNYLRLLDTAGRP